MAKYAITYHTDLKTESEDVSTIMKIFAKDAADLSGKDISMAIFTLIDELKSVLANRPEFSIKMDRYEWLYTEACFSSMAENINNKLKEIK